jgi:hypothetical protein
VLSTTAWVIESQAWHRQKKEGSTRKCEAILFLIIQCYQYTILNIKPTVWFIIDASLSILYIRNIKEATFFIPIVSFFTIIFFWVTCAKIGNLSFFQCLIFPLFWNYLYNLQENFLHNRIIICNCSVKSAIEKLVKRWNQKKKRLEAGLYRYIYHKVKSTACDNT